MTNTLTASHVTIVRPCDAVYHGWVVSQVCDVITLDGWTAWYDDTDAPYVAPAGDLVSIRVGDDTSVEVND